MDNTKALIRSAPVISNTQVALDTFRMVLDVPDIAARIEPGQFVSLSVPSDSAQILRIPLSYASSHVRSGTLELIYTKVGEGTRLLSELKPSSNVSVLGPLGSGWNIQASLERTLLVAGGIGFTPIICAARELSAKDVGFDAIVGAKCDELLIHEDIDILRSLALESRCDCARKVLITTDDGSCGRQATTTDVLSELIAERAYEQVFACGPLPMLKKVQSICYDAGLSCKLSLEAMMGCGFGVCSCCIIARADSGYAKCCTDGPVFDGSEVRL